MTDCKNLLLLGLSLLSQQAQAQKGATEERPNILFILSDDHTSQAWGIYGGILEPYVKNENIRRLAQEGCVLDNCFCTNSISAPSRATLITGAYSQVNGVRTLEDKFDTRQDQIAKRLQNAGYQTALYGKWHLKSEPQGFDEYSVLHDQGEYVNPYFKDSTNWKDDDEGRSGRQEQGFSTDLITDKCIQWLDKADPSKPFLLCCHFKATHEPWDFPARNKDLYKDVVFPEPADMMDFDGKAAHRTFHGQQLENLGWRWTQASHGPWWCQYPELPFGTEGMDSVSARKKIYQKLIRDYLRCGATIDQNIGRLLKYLDQKGLSRNTIVVYISDQGYFLGEHGFFDKRMMYEEPLRMPCVIRYPKEIPAGTRNHDIILNIDFAATLADYAHTQAPSLSQGRSFRQNLAGHTPKNWRKDMYYRYWTHHVIRPAHMGIRNQRYKLMFLYGNRLDATGSEDKPTKPAWEFYDLQTDPHEDHNVYDDPHYSSVIKKMKRRMLQLRKEYDDEDLTSATMQQLLKEWY